MPTVGPPQTGLALELRQHAAGIEVEKALSAGLFLAAAHLRDVDLVEAGVGVGRECVNVPTNVVKNTDIAARMIFGVCPLNVICRIGPIATSMRWSQAVSASAGSPTGWRAG